MGWQACGIRTAAWFEEQTSDKRRGPGHSRSKIRLKARRRSDLSSTRGRAGYRSPDVREESHPCEDSFYYATRFYGNRVVFNPKPQPGDPAVVVTTRFGAFLSRDLGTTWTRIDTTAISHHFIGAAWSQGHLYLATFGEGIVRSNKPIQP
jgi:hypothetical protein